VHGDTIPPCHAADKRRGGHDRSCVASPADERRMSEGDWEPLPEERRLSHPGEFASAPAADDAPAAGNAARPIAADAPAAAPPPPPDPEAEAALRRLQQRIAAAGPATSLVAEVQHREQRAARRRAAARAPFADQAKVVRSGLRGPEDVPPPSEVAAPVEQDPREQEPWFRALPASQQERLKAHWWHERHRHDRAGVLLQRRLGRAVGHGALLFFVLSLLLVMLLGGLSLVPMLTAGGALAAGAAELCGGGRFVYAVAGGAVFVLVLGPMAFLQPFLLLALMLITYSMGCLGMDGEMRRSGGFVDA
jgi:hypothetical protein